MNATRLAVVAVFATLAAVLLAWWTAPDHGPDVVAQAPTPATVASAPPPPAAATGVARPRPTPSSGAIPPLPDRRPAPYPVIERIPADETHTADQPGLGLAAIERRADLVDCWDAYLEAGGGTAGRFTIKLTLTDAGNDRGALAVEVPQVPDDPELHGCVNAVFADARFDSPGEIAQSVVWPVPLSPASGEPPD
jgi:hypothetical protein